MGVIEHHAPVWESQEHKWSAGLGAAARLAAAQARLLRGAPQNFDAVIVGYPGHADLPAARRVARDRPVIFNPLVSLTDTLVEDRKRFRPGSLPARILRAIDRHALRAADLVVADTEANASHLVRLAELDPGRVRVCLVGAEERLFQSGWRPESPRDVLFIGKLIPLHGLETILAAAALAPELRFRIIGSGQLGGLLRKRRANVEWIPWVEYASLPGQLHQTGCSLGIFGTSAKAARVIPNKAFQALACATPLVTADTPGARELLEDGESALLVPPGDPQALAAVLRRLAGDPELAHRLSRGGRSTYEAKASERVLGARWRALVEELL